MPIPQLNLDDRTFDQLAAEGRALIVRYFPAWTDYNESDPGVTLLELFAFFTETAIYEINRVPERSLERFAALVGITRTQGEAIGQTLRRALESLKQQYRAVTETDFEALAIAANPSAIARSKAVVEEPPATIIATVQAVSGTTITVSPFGSTLYGLRVGAAIKVPGQPAVTTLAEAIPAKQAGVTRIVVEDASFASSVQRGDELEIAVEPTVFPFDQFVKVVIVPKPASGSELPPTEALRQQVFEYLAPRRLITTRVKVVPPDNTTVSVTVTAVRDATSRVQDDALANSVRSAITGFFSPVSGGVDGKGWPFGRSVFRSELESVIEGLEGIDHIRQLLLNGDENIGEVKLVSALSLVSLGQLSVNVVDS
ncbi:MAG: baseplate J/gp47 family protein [Acidobacteriia bacterium]|nr:baseplate J/gp47 family protein [Terriglobia bacterium]